MSGLLTYEHFEKTLESLKEKTTGIILTPEQIEMFRNHNKEVIEGLKNSTYAILKGNDKEGFAEEVKQNDR